MVAKRPQMAIISKQHAHAARPPTGPRAAASGFTITECLVSYTLDDLERKTVSTRLSNYKITKKVRFVYLLFLAVFAHLVFNDNRTERKREEEKYISTCFHRFYLSYNYEGEKALYYFFDYIQLDVGNTVFSPSLFSSFFFLVRYIYRLKVIAHMQLYGFE